MLEISWMEPYLQVWKMTFPIERGWFFGFQPLVFSREQPARYEATAKVLLGICMQQNAKHVGSFNLFNYVSLTNKHQKISKERAALDWNVDISNIQVHLWKLTAGTQKLVVWFDVSPFSKRYDSGLEAWLFRFYRGWNPTKLYGDYS